MDGDGVARIKRNGDELDLVGCVGPNSEYVKLISSDGSMFIVKREHALISGTIKAMLQGPGKFSETECNEIHFKNIPAYILYHICLYFVFKHCYSDDKEEETPTFHIDPNIALRLMMAANYLNC